ncbi:probable VMA9 Subunit e of the Vo (membrane) sector of the vacuolar H+-ATPase, essential for vacuolar acidification [Ramularia collo-cygni]|uniref:Probable VMA9 Subunit e of the Vo (Membrane) sector of the vacuolar H+-ATPase, essential for vacuolar acidification n=1 Tax=Ramularia collo-cygni TaxID=112498 RepID=A0A2D3UY60_9PEZI|nr:probable VMA9 Subunit e of the Vo (membrane) sector of the vacuolar H+-ATPase, essential for vacuolar acidification [Ramularia collo-cygni]CZT19295.1 probable VMA9 Subunit e of the Vo (membrane) sector of the vacuolar H+-ATPase, essential for vacuolar acidification [Ramularia collo-cygni]
MANGWSLLISILVVVGVQLLAWFFSPKGENQTVWRSTVILSAAACWLMWAITFLAQWHPLIVPERSDLRPEFNGGVKSGSQMF